MGIKNADLCRHFYLSLRQPLFKSTKTDSGLEFHGDREPKQKLTNVHLIITGLY